MNQTKKRLSIIKLAISITDIDCIQHQILKLSQLKSDNKLQEILDMLQAKNYAQAQGLITTYIETPMDEIMQRTSLQGRASEPLQNEEEKAIIEEFDLFTAPEDQSKIEKLEDIDAFISDEIPPTKSYESTIDYDALLTLEASDILPDNIDIDLSAPKEDTFFEEVSLRFEEEKTVKDDFFDTELLEKERAPSEEKTLSQLIQEKNPSEDEKEHTDGTYTAIPYIEQKLNNMIKQYPPLTTSDEKEVSVTRLLEKIKSENYTEEEIEESVDNVLHLIQNGKKSEAAKLLLIAASTPSLYAQFILARALFKGEILQKNIPEAFSIIYRLANDEGYPEAICDLAQLHEYGIGVEKDIQKAEALYREAMDLGIQRAKSHVERIRKENKGLFSLFKK